MSVLGSGITALNAFRNQLVTTSHNVANVNTEGYSRQVVDLGTMPASKITAGYIGNGVQIENVRRQFDQFLMDRVRSYTSSNEDYQIFVDRARRVDDILADPDSGLSQAIQDFFNSVQDVADDPASTSTRNVMLNSAEVMTERFVSVYEFLESMRGEINQDIKVLVSEANTLSQSIAMVNAEIQLVSDQSGTQLPNDLLDKRDSLISELSKFVNVTSVPSNDGTVNVFIGSGQALIIGTRALTLDTSVNEAEPDRLNITLDAGAGVPNDITNTLSGGKLGGYFRFRDTILDPSMNALGRLAMGLGEAFNEQHKLGMDLNGQLGRDFFTVPDDQNSNDLLIQQMILASPVNNGGPLTITDIDEANLTTSDYELKYNGASFEVYDRQTGLTTIPIVDGSGNITFGGVSLQVTATAPHVNNDSYIIRPTRLATRAFAVEVLDGREIAAASPVFVSKTTSGTNSSVKITDSGLISNDPANTLLPANVTLTYDTSRVPPGFNVSAGVTAIPATQLDYVASVSGKVVTVNLTNLGEFTFTLSGAPVNGDVFTLGDNTNGIGDNRNMRELADLQLEKTMLNDTNGNSTTSFSGLYSNLIGEVGSKTRQAIVNNETQIKLREQATTSLDAVSGVNLDEEAANLVTFQQAYQAASQIIRISNTLFDSLLNAVR